jgi:hypothetical protein
MSGSGAPQGGNGSDEGGDDNLVTAGGDAAGEGQDELPASPPWWTAPKVDRYGDCCDVRDPSDC